MSISSARRAAEIRALGVARLAVFGSVLRGEPNADSDVDVLVQFAPGAKSYDVFIAQLGEPGASTKDVADAAEFLRSMAATTKGPAGEMRRNWLPYLEARLVRVTGNTSGAVEP